MSVQYRTPLLDPEDNQINMTRQPLQLQNSCDDDDEHDLPGNEGIFRVMVQQQNRFDVLTESDANQRDSAPGEYAAGIPQPPWYQQPQQISAMISNFSTSYNAVNVSLVLPILKVALHSSMTEQQHVSSLVENAEGAVASSLLAGMMMGQILGGILGDLVGPSVALRLVMLLQIIASIGSSCSDLVSLQSMPSSSSLKIYWHLAAWRFLLGIGAGGVYPLAAVLSATNQSKQHENMRRDTVDSDADENDKLHRVVLTFSTQGLGFITVPLVAVLLLHLLPNSLDVVWRLMLGFGCIPGMFLLVWQWRSLHGPSDMQPLPQQEQEREGLYVTDEVIDELDIDCANNDASGDNENGSVVCSTPDSDIVNDVDVHQDPHLPTPPSALAMEGAEAKNLWESIRNEENLIRKLLGTAATWFLFDVLFYGNTLFQPIVMEAAFGLQGNENPVHSLQHTARNSFILTLIALPGYVVASTVLGKSSVWCYCGIEQTPRFVMMQGFGVMAILYFTIGSTWDTLRRFPTMLVLLYSLTFFFANFGPNTTTFVLPSLVFSEECRSTFNGLSAAAGKLGALTGATLFEPASDRLGSATVMLLCSLISVVALILTKFFVPISMHHSNNVHRPNHMHIRVPNDLEVE
jgi:MFS transporter, PHS family, inorganic phosphate transporter